MGEAGEIEEIVKIALVEETKPIETDQPSEEVITVVKDSITLESKTPQAVHETEEVVDKSTYQETVELDIPKPHEEDTELDEKVITVEFEKPQEVESVFEAV